MSIHKNNSFITTHRISANTNGTLYYFPKTLRDVYAFRIRVFASRAAFGTYGSIINIICPDLVSGFREGSQNSQLLHSVAVFPTNALPPVYSQPKHFFMRDGEINQLKFNFVDENGNHIVFNPVDDPYFVIDFFHHNKL